MSRTITTFPINGKTIKDLDPEESLGNAQLLFTGDPITGALKKATIAQLVEFMPVFDPTVDETITADLWDFKNKVNIGDNKSAGLWMSDNDTILGDWAGNGNNTNIDINDNDGSINATAGIIFLWQAPGGSLELDYPTIVTALPNDGSIWAANGGFSVDQYGNLVAGSLNTEGNINLLNGGRTGITTPQTYQTRVGTPSGWNGTFLQIDDNAENVQIWCYDWDEDNAMASFNGDGSGVLAYSNISWDRPGNVLANSYTASDGAIASQAWVEGQGYGYGTSNYNPSFSDEGGSGLSAVNGSWNVNGTSGQISFDAGAITSNGYGALSAYALTINSDVDNSSASLSTTSLQFSSSDDGGGSTTSMYSANNVGISYTDDYGETSYTSLDYAAVSGGYVAEGVTQSSWFVSSSGISLSNFGSTFFNVDGAGNIEAPSINLGGTEGTAIYVPSGAAVIFDGGDFFSDGIGNVTVSSLVVSGLNAAINNDGTGYLAEGVIVWDGAGNMSANSIYSYSDSWAINWDGSVVFDEGAITSDGLGNVTATSFRPSVFTNTTMAEIPSPQVGQIVYNSDLETLVFYTPDGWKAVTSSFP